MSTDLNMKSDCNLLKSDTRSFGQCYSFSSMQTISSINSSNETNSKPERETWIGKADFFLSALAYAVGLGAVWRFPYLCYKNGGGVFLIPYFIFLFVIGVPLVFLEMCVGQFTSTGPLTCWRMAPIFRGIGLSMNIVNGYLCIYYNMILAYSIYYIYELIVNISSEIPWAKCDPSRWPSTGCVDNFANLTFLDCNKGLKCPNGKCYNLITLDFRNATCTSSPSMLKELGFWKISFPSQDFWTHEVLQKSDSINQTGHIVWQLALALFIAWIFVYLMVINGIRVSGLLVYFTAIFPYVILIILGINGWLLEGADIGINYYIYPDFSRLKDFQVWSDAAIQIFFTLSVSYGGMVALSSYNDFKTNVLRDAIFVSLSNCLTSVFAGFVIFAYMGNLAYFTKQNMSNILQEGQGLAYVVYPFAVTTLKGNKIWAFLFFFMMLVLGLDTMMASVETMITSLYDLLPKLKKNRLTRTLTITLICVVCFMIGLVFCTQSGTYCGSWAVLFVAALECIAVGWIYGFDKFKRDVSIMIGSRITDHWSFEIWRVAWCYLSPIVLIALTVATFLGSKNFKPNGIELTFWSIMIGKVLTVSTFLGVFTWIIYSIIDSLFISKRDLRKLFKADNGWRPMKQEHRLLMYMAHNTQFNCYDSIISTSTDYDDLKGTFNEGSTQSNYKF